MIGIRCERPGHIAAIRTVNEAALGQSTEADIVGFGPTFRYGLSSWKVGVSLRTPTNRGSNGC
jgi:hypothetical protein